MGARTVASRVAIACTSAPRAKGTRAATFATEDQANAIEIDHGGGETSRIGFQRTGATADPLPVRFSGYIVSWNRGTEPVVVGRPRRGQFVCAAATAVSDRASGSGL